MKGALANPRLRMLVLALHLAALVGGLWFVWVQATDIMAQQAAIEAAQVTVDDLQARLNRNGSSGAASVAAPAADPFLQGATATVAGADLQERIVSAIRAAGGAVTSSAVEAPEPGAGPPKVVLTVSCDLADAALQRLLYTIEAGTPAVFLDQLAIEAAAPDSRDPSSAASMLKVSMTVSAYWAGSSKS